MPEIPTPHLPSKKSGNIGPLPVWAWGALLGLVAVGYIYFRRGSGGAAPAPAPATVNASSGYPLLTSDPLGSSGGGIAATPGGANANAPGNGSSFSNNADWTAAAVTFLALQNVTNPLAAQRALEDYLAGNALTYTQGQWVDQVVRKIGLPPQGTQGSPIVGTKPTPVPPAKIPAVAPVARPPVKVAPKPPVKAAAPSYSSYRVNHGDTISGIARKYYGHSNLHDWQVIAKANGISVAGRNAYRINAGQTIKVPRNG